MSHALKTFVVRSPVALSGQESASFGIPSHPPRYRSQRYLAWITACQANDAPALDAAIDQFLASAQRVRTLDDLGPGWEGIVSAFQWQGSRITKAAALEMLEEGNVDRLVGADGRFVGDARTAVADTMLALACTRQLSARGTLDHQAVLRVMAFVERTIALKRHLPEKEVAGHFTRPILLPTQCFAIDRCQVAKPVVGGPRMVMAGGGKGDTAVLPVLPLKDPCGCEPDNTCVDQNPCCATVTQCVIDLMVVRDHTRCYRAGDLSFIKNVLAGETLSTRHRTLDRTQEVDQKDTEQVSSSERDLQTEDKSALKTEIDNTVKESLALDAGVTSNISFGIGKVVQIGIATSNSLSANYSKERSNKEARDYSRDVIDRAVNKLETTVKRSRTITTLSETEETNKHRFTNASSDNMCGQYLYVDRVSRAQLYNHRKVAAIEICLPEPAALYVALLELKYDGTPPVKPVEFSTRPNQITDQNYLALGLQYDVFDLAVPPASSLNIDVLLSGSPSNTPSAQSFAFPCTIPAGYVGVSMSAPMHEPSYKNNILVSRSITASLRGIGIHTSRSADGQNTAHWSPNSPATPQNFSSPIEGAQTIAVDTLHVTGFGWLLTIQCTLKPQALIAWQTGVYQKVKEAYTAQLGAYNTALKNYIADRDAFDVKEAARRAARYNQSPFILREIERAELKRMAISYISCQFFDQFNAMRQRVKPCGHPQMDIRKAQLDGRVVQFFEQAFDWNLMTYLFYRYFWGRKSTWADKLHEESSDPIFKQFLSAGSARVLLPIRDGYAEYVQIFLSTGEIWGNSGQPPLPDDPHFVSIAQEMKEQMGNYYVDREGRIQGSSGSNQVTLDNGSRYWNLGDPAASPPIPAHVDALAIAADLDRELTADFRTYRIVAIDPDPSGSAPPAFWTMTLDRPFEGEPATDYPWSTGAVFVGTPWEFTTPTTLTFLRETSKCLPCYPLKDCKEP
ncbi:MAG: hypothetical protein JWM95_5604 [Gemmatimonadetes bacterium]|nr:hypothetical protein [Gemmatimonadota bacterium]